MQQQVRKAASVSATILAPLGLSHPANAQGAESGESQNATPGNIVAPESTFRAACDLSARNCLDEAPWFVSGEFYAYESMRKDLSGQVTDFAPRTAA